MNKHNNAFGKNSFNMTIIIFGLLILFSCKKETKPENNTVTNKIDYSSYIVDSVNFINDTIIYDLSGDNHFEIKLTMRFNQNGSMMQYGGDIYGIDSNMTFCYLKTVPTTSFIKLNDPISNNSSYNWVNKITYNGGAPYFQGSNSWAYGVFTDYFGFKITLNNIQYYGWFHLKFFAICEIGFNETPNATILVGQKQ